MNLAAFLQNNNVFMQENRAFKKIAAAAKVHIFLQLVQKFSDFRLKIKMFLWEKKKKRSFKKYQL